MNSELINEIKKIIPEEHILENELMSRHTMFRVGGPADCFVRITQTSQLKQLVKLLHQEKEDYYIVGNGSNLLVSDQGYRGCILCTAGGLDQIIVDGRTVIVEAGALNSAIAQVAGEHALTGFEFAAGIPGTIGGGMVMNAGAYGSEMANVVQSVEVLSTDGTVKTLTNEQMQFGYRSSIVRDTDKVVLSVSLALTEGEPEEIRAAMAELAARRADKQPLEYPSAGSTFKRPKGFFAGKLIMDAGLRGFTVGGAQISEKHCGFVINRNHATARDVYMLISQVQDKVQCASGVHLEPEVIMLGDFKID
ncbi:MAG: UDP-N-acetylmuramate dehydrogenase [Butyrivibrio sp.]|nr:UDP-N-acetylmuramate dehydrogenase [Butyrivibrio sp.]